MILDEAQHIKNWKSQRWQTLLNFNTERRLLLTGTPLQNDLMELWSLMHFLMPSVFQSRGEWKDWFMPVDAMVQGQQAFNEKLISTLHSILRPFLLRRLKKEVEKDLPPKYEHIIMCNLSRRQRLLYEEFISSTLTQSTLKSGSYIGIANVLMQLRKVCNHPDLFEVRPIISPFDLEGITYRVPSIVAKAREEGPFSSLSLPLFNLNLMEKERSMSMLASHLISEIKVKKEDILREGNMSMHPKPDPQLPPIIYAQKLKEYRKAQRKAETLHHFAYMNDRRCQARPVLGTDAVEFLEFEDPCYSTISKSQVKYFPILSFLLTSCF